MSQVSTDPQHAGRASESSKATEGSASRRARGVALVVGALVILALVETKAIAFYWFPVLTGLTYLAAAVAGRSRGALWGPGFVTTSVGLAAALWLSDGRPADSFEFLALAVMALGLGGVLATLVGRARGFEVGAMSVSLAVLLFGLFALLEQQAVKPVAGHAWPYAVLLVVWGAYELRPRSA